MQPQSPLFREQALAYHLAGHTWRGDLLRIPRLWSVWAFGFLMLAVGAGLLLTSLVSITQYASGPAVVCRPSPRSSAPGTAPVLAFIPARDQDRLVPGMPLLFREIGSGEGLLQLSIDEVSEIPIAPADARRRVPAGLLDAVALDGPVVVITARPREATSASPGASRPTAALLASCPDALGGSARVSLGSTRLASILMRPLLSAGGA